MATISPIAERLESLASWRVALDRQLMMFGQWLIEQDLLSDADASGLIALRERLASDKLVLAFVAEFSRGKSELINAIFFADAGRRVLPATPGRTTMCPVELRFDADVAPRLALLPIETRLRGLSLAETRLREDHWQHLALDPRQPQSLVRALEAVTATQRVSVEIACALGLWNQDQPEDNPPQAADGTVEVPAWRHAVINYPHPLLERGLVVIDTPGLNAVGAEPELTLGLLPSAHAVVFVLAADTGVTRSDLAIWREHLGQESLERFVVLNKIDALVDPMLSVAAVDVQIEHQKALAAEMLGMPLSRVFALSAREALAARFDGNPQALRASRLPPLEQALADELLPHREKLLLHSAESSIERLLESTSRRLAERRRQLSEQLFELRGLRGKSGAKLRMMVERAEAEVTEFERCTPRLAALRAVQTKQLRSVLATLSSEALRIELGAMLSAMGSRPFNLGAGAAFDTLMSRLHAALDAAAAQAEELRQMMQGSFDRLNADFGFAFTLSPLTSMAPFHGELTLIEQNYRRYLSLGQAWRMAAPGFAEQFRRMLLSKLRIVFENAAGTFEMWCKAATGQVDGQLRDRRRAFARRSEALERVQSAAEELEQRIDEVRAQDDHLADMQARLVELTGQALATASRAVARPAAAEVQPSLRRDAA